MLVLVLPFMQDSQAQYLQVSNCAFMFTIFCLPNPMGMLWKQWSSPFFGGYFSAEESGDLKYTLALLS